MKFSPMEKEARQFVLDSGEATIDDIWKSLGKKEKRCWRSSACELMRRVCLKSNVIPPKIHRKTPLGRGSKAVYEVLR